MNRQIKWRKRFNIYIRANVAGKKFMIQVKWNLAGYNNIEIIEKYIIIKK